MKLTSVLSSHFSNTTRARGVSYYNTASVRIQTGSETQVVAAVRGARTYEVEITCADGTLTLWCDCPFFEASGPCKHLWATVLAAERAGYLSAADDLPSEAVNYDYPDLDEPAEEEDESSTFEVYLPQAGAPASPPPKPKPPDWRRQLDEIGSRAADGGQRETWPADRQLLYVVDAAASAQRGELIVRLMTREPRQTGGWKKPAVPRLSRYTLSLLADPADRRLLSLLTDSGGYNEWSMASTQEAIQASYRILHPLSETAMPLLAATGRCFLQTDAIEQYVLPLAWDAGEAWRLEMYLEQPDDEVYQMRGKLQRESESIPLDEPVLITRGGLVFTRERVGRLAADAPYEWIVALRRYKVITVPVAEASDFITAVLEHPMGAKLHLPTDLRCQEIASTPRPCLTIRNEQPVPWHSERLCAYLGFDYDGRRISAWQKSRGLYDAASRRYLLRDAETERAALDTMNQLGLSGPFQAWSDTEPKWTIAAKRLPGVVRTGLEAGWHIEAEGKTFRRPGAVNVRVSSGVDWFELHGEVSYGEATAKLPALLTALRRGDNMVRLDDGTYGLLPEEWLSRFGHLAGLGSSEKDHIRFRKNQAGLLDALLAAQPEVECDAAFTRLRDQLQSFHGIHSGEQPEGFVGQLRDYQREGVGWIEFLRRFGFGGCLADDMGVGKTAQVLAVLESRRALRAGGDEGPDAPRGPSLVVVPKSLVFNWKQEAARFTPQLRLVDHTGLTRSMESFSDCDVVLTTYGTLRRDAIEFKDLEFDYVVLDEAQAIKNAGTESAKAVRLLRGRHRLALSGTPVENHLGELWSLFEFLNPGMLGAASVFKLGGGSRNPGEETRRLLAHALRPFFLRRTKAQVTRELPSKTEQTIFCEMEPAERKLYNELRSHYRNSLLRRIDNQGLAKSKMHVLEALLRLRQAACHPGLLDAKRSQESSSKLDLLLANLADVAEEGHKALVFSQFTSLLAIVRHQLDEAGIVYEYLDGATRDRQERVERFQNDPECRLFLISLKAGGLGLNLTAAEYIFLLDPWWNPAVEAQAIDRAHRIGQDKPVFAYRLIARDTVEEKVLQLQSTKRDLAAAILSEDNSLIRNLQREDLELLLS
jgi:superfamily II DNA or RNA helicase